MGRLGSSGEGPMGVYGFAACVFACVTVFACVATLSWRSTVVAKIDAEKTIQQNKIDAERAIQYDINRPRKLWEKKSGDNDE